MTHLPMPELKNEPASLYPGSITYLSPWHSWGRTLKVPAAVWLWLCATLAACAPMTPEGKERLRQWAITSAMTPPTPVYYYPIPPAPRPVVDVVMPWPGYR